MYRSNGMLVAGVLVAALGAVLRFAVSDTELFSIDLAVVGIILILVGIVLAVVALVQMVAGSGRRV